MVGVQTLLGKAPDTLGNGIGSIGIGLGACYTGFAWSEGLGTILSAFEGLTLVVAGVIALMARSQYKAWYASKVAATAPPG